MSPPQTEERGKDFPRKVNSRVLFEIGCISALGDKFASGEGIQDALFRTSAMLRKTRRVAERRVRGAR